MARVKKVSVTCKLNEDDVAFLDRLAAISDRDRSYLIRQAVGEFIALHKWQLEDIDRAIREADCGEFASDEEVHVMFQELGQRGPLKAIRPPYHAAESGAKPSRSDRSEAEPESTRSPQSRCRPFRERWRSMMR